MEAHGGSPFSRCCCSFCLFICFFFFCRERGAVSALREEPPETPRALARALAQEVSPPGLPAPPRCRAGAGPRRRRPPLPAINPGLGGGARAGAAGWASGNAAPQT